ncbi:MAG TPA: hypothetical protein DEB06_05760, partial [Phycisphaerales bacterium]|nr:hypothetical protein [Phycisphaerales bacterium]
EAVRREWGVPPGEPVVLACGAPASAIDAKWFSYQVGVMSVAGLFATVVLPARAAQSDRGVRFSERHKHPWRIVFDERPVWEIARGADLALWARAGVSDGLREGSSTVTPPEDLAWAAALGLAVVCEDDAASRSVLRGLEPSVRFVSAARPTALIDEMMEVLSARRAPRVPDLPAHRDAPAWAEGFEQRVRLSTGRLRALESA